MAQETQPAKITGSADKQPWALYVIIIALLLAVLALLWFVLTAGNGTVSNGSGARDLQDRIEALELELAESKMREESSDRVGEALIQNDPRIVLTPDVYEDYSAYSPANLDADQEASVYAALFNFDRPNEYLTYRSDKGFRIDLPYNAAWGNNIFRVPLFDEEGAGNRVSYGPIGVVEGGGWGRPYSLAVLPARSVSEIETAVSSDFLTLGPETITVNGHTVVKYMESGLCDFPVYEVLGDEYNIELSVLCGDNESFTLFDRMVGTLEK